MIALNIIYSIHLSKVSAGCLRWEWLVGGYHELLKGPEKEEVLQCIVKWILAHSNPGIEAAATPAPAHATGVHC